MAKQKRSGKRLRLPDVPHDVTTQLIDRLNGLLPSVPTDYLLQEFLSKYVSPDTAPPEVRRTRAINKWLATEMENYSTNERLLITSGTYNILPRVTFMEFVEWCRNAISCIIGETPPIEALIGSFSGGASTSRSRTSSHPASKYLGEAHVTADCLEYFNLIKDEIPGWPVEEHSTPVVVPGNVLFTVPKKTDIDRVACKEPDLNMFIQKGIGSYLGRCLLRTGINLNDQSRNRSLAREGSITNKLATLDLSSASDSLSQGLVALFLPVTWYTLLDASRSRVTIIDGEEHQNEMFSSMGNGFTFELESLIFLVLTRAVRHFRRSSGVVSVYGDDIICPAGDVPDLTWVLQYFGFQVNPDKSFSEGPFRESCGGHYYNGYDITPFYIKGPITSMVDLIHVANQLREWGSLEVYRVVDPEIEPIWLWLKSMIPSYLWGGEDTSFKYQLVSFDIPQYRLVEESVKRSTGLGGYFHWLNATWERTLPTDGVSTSSRSVARPGKVRLRKVRRTAVPRLPSLFSSEIERYGRDLGAQRP